MCANSGRDVQDRRYTMGQSFPSCCYFNKICIVFREKLHHCNTLSYEMRCLVVSCIIINCLPLFFGMIREKKKKRKNIFGAFCVTQASRHVVKNLNHGWRKFTSYFRIICVHVLQGFFIRFPGCLFFWNRKSVIRGWGRKWKLPEKIHTGCYNIFCATFVTENKNSCEIKNTNYTCIFQATWLKSLKHALRDQLQL